MAALVRHRTEGPLSDNGFDIVPPQKV